MYRYIVTAAAAAAASAAGYQSMAPTGQWFGHTFTGLGRGSKQLALTYDDGPNDPHTQRLLDVLARHDVHATFFLIGRYVQQRPDIVREIVKAGHVVGNHTFTHPLLIFKSARELRSQLDNCRSRSDRRHRRTLQSVSPAFWRPASCGAAHRPSDGTGTDHVERDWLRLERNLSRADRAQSDEPGPGRKCNLAARWRTS